MSIIFKAPSLDELREFVRQSLPAEQRRDIYRWLVACSDPDLSTILFNLQLEWEQVQADQSLSQEKQELGALFLSLWEQNCASFDDFLPRPIARQTFQYASPLEQKREGITITRRGEEAPIGESCLFDVVIKCAEQRPHAFAVWTGDLDEQEPELFFDSHQNPSELPSFEFKRKDRRVTFWFVAADDRAKLGPRPPRTSRDFVRWLLGVQERQNTYIQAIRLTHRALTDLYE